MKKSLLVSLIVLLSLNSQCFATSQNICKLTGCADMDFSRDRGFLQFNCTVTKGDFLFSARDIKIIQGLNTLRLHPFFAHGYGNTPLVQCNEDALCLEIIKQDEAITGTIHCLPKWFNIDQTFTIFYKGTKFQFDTLPATTADNTTFTVIDHVIAGEIDNGTCATPVAVNTYTTKDSVVHSWLSFKNAKINDVLEWKFYGPNSARYDCRATVIEYESGCYYWGLFIKGHRLQFMPGNWSVDVYYNGILQFTDTFIIKSSRTASAP